MANTLFLRNLETGKILEVEPFDEKHLEVRLKRDSDGHFVWEETSPADADPEKYAHPDEVAARRQWGVTPLSFVKADGTPTSKAAEKAVAGRDPGMVPVPVPVRDPANP